MHRLKKWEVLYDEQTPRNGDETIDRTCYKQMERQLIK